MEDVTIKAAPMRRPTSVNENQVPYLTESAGTKPILALVEDPHPGRADLPYAGLECGPSSSQVHRSSAWVLNPGNPKISLH